MCIRDRAEGLLWIEIAPVAAEPFLEGFWLGFAARVAEHLAVTPYAPPTGDECAAAAPGGYGGAGAAGGYGGAEDEAEAYDLGDMAPYV